MKVQNPFRVGGSYYSVVAALEALGVGKMHSAEQFSKAFAEAMGPAKFAEFKAVKPRSKKGKPWQERILQNGIVVCRPDYGAPLREVGFEVLKERDKDGYSFGLFPIKGFKPKAQAVAPVARSNSKVARKAVKAKAKGKTAKTAKSKGKGVKAKK
ncbi:MAG: hypothetical protein ABSH08_07300 [Tepidisphaeraceae bacterium]|jgi:hypothetical protein